MATNTNTDLTEEDAADLQFPKDSTALFDTGGQTDIQSKCSNCSNDLISPYIQCVECDIGICTACFAAGVEFGDHKSDHSYSIYKDDFTLFDNSDWTANEEVTLLEGLRVHRNWDNVAKLLPNRTVQEIQEHYDNCYLNRTGSDLLPKVPETESSLFPQPVIPYRFKLTDIQEPPRFTPGTVSYSAIAGYNAARSDFEIKYDTNAEDLVVHLPTIQSSDPDYNLMSDLHYAIGRIYNRRLEERKRRMKIMREHGLISHRKVTAWLHRYDVTITPSVYDRLVRFMKFFNGEHFEYFMEGLHRAGELKIQIARLCDFRRKGITTLEGARLYMSLKQKHDENNKELRSFQMSSQFKPAIKAMPALFPAKRRSTYTPLDVVGMPGYEKLLPKEKDLCRNVRLVPLTYLELKETLIAENNKLGHLRLLTARRLLKIDVNKTRKLYDFLVQEGFITQPK